MMMINIPNIDKLKFLYFDLGVRNWPTYIVSPNVLKTSLLFFVGLPSSIGKFVINLLVT